MSHSSDREARWAVATAFLHFEAWMSLVVGVAGAVTACPLLFARVPSWTAVLLVGVVAVVVRARTALAAARGLHPPRAELERALRVRLSAWPAFTALSVAIPPGARWLLFALSLVLMAYGVAVVVRRTWMGVARHGDGGLEPLHRFAASRGARVALATAGAVTLLALTLAG